MRSDQKLKTNRLRREISPSQRFGRNVWFANGMHFKLLLYLFRRAIWHGALPIRLLHIHKFDITQHRNYISSTFGKLEKQKTIVRDRLKLWLWLKVSALALSSSVVSTIIRNYKRETQPPPLKNCSFVSIFILPSETSLTCFIIQHGIVAQTAFSILQTSPASSTTSTSFEAASSLCYSFLQCVST